MQKIFRFYTKDNLSLCYRLTEGTNKELPTLLHIHGLHSHSLYDEQFYYLLHNAGFTVAGLDLRGHGMSGGKHGHIQSYSLFLDDIHRFIDELEEKTHSKRYILCGHSLGGNIALNYVASNVDTRLIGCIGIAPFIQLVLQPPRLITALLPLKKVLSALAPTLYFKTGLVSKTDTLRDPLLTEKITVRFFNEVIPRGEWLFHNCKFIKIPTLIIHESDDKVTSAAASRRLAELNPTYITTVIFTGDNHSVHRGINKLRLVSEILKFTNKIVYE